MKLIVIIFSLLAIFTFCSKQKKIGKEIFEGHIYDSINGGPANGIGISISACVPRDGRNFCTTFSFGSTTSDADGYFKIEGKPARSRRYFISAPGNNMKEPKEFDSFDQRDIKLYIYK